MNTAISIPNPLHALRRFLARYRQAKVTEQLNAIYGTQTSHADSAVLIAQRERLQRDAGPEGW